MKSLREIFFSQFEDRWHNALIEFAKSISDSEADVLIFMARKSACLFQCLEDLRLCHTSAVCTSDVALGSNLDWLAGKRIQLFDDTLITGTTLYRAINRLQDSGASVLKTTVLCVDRENWCPALVTPSPPYLNVEAHDVTAFSSQAVRAIGVIPRPYSVDFPLYDNIVIKGDKLDSPLINSGWHLDDITTTRQADCGVLNVTMTPAPYMVRELDDRFGWAVSGRSQLMKVRLYARQSSAGKGFTCRALPLVAFDPMTHNQIKYLWRALRTNIPSLADLDDALPSENERLRLLQFVCASHLFRAWMHDVGLSSNKQKATANRRQVDFAFAPTIRDAVLAAMDHELQQPLAGTPKFTTSPRPIRHTLSVPPRFHGTDLPGIQARLTEPFLELFQSRELIARRLVKRYGRNTFDLPKYQQIVNRLNHGISLPELRSRLKHLRSDDATRALLSTFIDEAIDRGVAVPITVVDETCVYRAYRHGEDVKFTEVEARLACLAIQEAIRTLGVTQLPKVVVEKLIVLLIRAGLRGGFIERWTGTLADRRTTAGIRYYLRGAVAQLEPDRCPYHYNPGESIASLLTGWGYLSETKGGYTVQTLPERPPTTALAERDARAFGAMMGLALERVPSKRRTEELTLVASCLEPVDAAAALAAEISYFERHWTLLCRALLAQGQSGNRADFVLRNHELYTAVNSGLWKWRGIAADLPKRVLANWYDRIGERPEAVFAEAILESALPIPDQVIPTHELHDLLASMGRWIFDVNIALRALRLALVGDEEPSTVTSLQRQINELERERDKRKRPRRSNQEQLSLPLDSMSSSGADQLIEVIRHLNTLCSSAGAILDRADAIVTPFGKPRNTVIYRHLLSLHLVKGNTPRHQRELDSIAHIVDQAVREIGDGTSTRVVALRHADQLLSCDAGVAIDGVGAKSSMLRMIKCVLDHRKTRIPLRFVIWLELEPDDRIVRAEKSSDVVGRNLQQRLAELARLTPHSAASDELIVVSSSGATLADSPSDARSLIDSYQLEQTSQSTLSMELPTRRDFRMDSYEIVSGINPDPRTVRADIAVITIVPEEMAAVVRMLRDSPGFQKVRRDGAIFYEGSIPAESGQMHRVVATQQLDQGNRSVIAAYERVCSAYEPSLVVLLGIGGSLRPDVAIGDVVLADQVVWYEQATETDEGIDRKGEASKLAAWLRRLVNDFLVEVGSPAMLEPHERSAFQVHFGPVGTGEKVIRFRESEARKWIKDYNYKALALETEAGGLAQAFYESTLSSRHSVDGYLVIRGISDHADKDKSDNYRAIASANACVTLAAFLATVPPIAKYVDSIRRPGG